MSRRLRIIAGLLRFLILASIVFAVYADIWGQNNKYAVEQREETYAELDHKTAMAAKGGGLYLHFANFPPQMNWLARDVYTRAVYSMYAQNVFASDPSVPIFSPDQFMAANGEHDADWCLRHGIRGELSFTYRSDGPIIETFRWFSTPPEDHQ